MPAYAEMLGPPSFRGAAEGREPGIQKQMLCLHLDSGSGADASSRNDSKCVALSPSRPGIAV